MQAGLYNRVYIVLYYCRQKNNNIVVRAKFDKNLKIKRDLPVS